MQSGREGYSITTRPSFYTEQFERVCPYYIAFGMSYEQFWDGDPEIAKHYRTAHEIQIEEQNQMAWLQGAYVYQAIGALAPALKAFAKGRPKEYMRKPLDMGRSILRAENAEKKRAAQIEKERAAMLAEKERFLQFARGVNKKFKAKGGEVNG